MVLHVYMIHSVTPAGLADLTKLQRLASLVLSTDYRDALPVASVAAMLQRLPQLRFFDMSKQATVCSAHKHHPVLTAFTPAVQPLRSLSIACWCSLPGSHWGERRRWSAALQTGPRTPHIHPAGAYRNSALPTVFLHAVSYVI